MSLPFLAIRKAKLARLLMAGLVIGLLGSCTSAGSFASPAGSEPAAAARSGSANLLAAGDVLGIAYPGAADLNQTQKIRTDGRVSLPIIGDVTAAGKTIPVLQQELVRLYTPHLLDARITLSLTSSASVVYVNGAVNSGGKIALDRPMTVFQGVMEAGGFTSVANPRKVILTREEGGRLERRVLNLEKNAADGVIPLKPFDTITVSEAWF